MLISNCRRCFLLLRGSQPTIKAGSIQCKAPKSQASARRRSIAGTLQSFTHASIFCHTNDLVGYDFLCVHKILYRFFSNLHSDAKRSRKHTFRIFVSKICYTIKHEFQDAGILATRGGIGTYNFVVPGLSEPLC